LPKQTTSSSSAYWAVVPAAGIGSRMNSSIPKQYLRINEREVLAWTLESLQDFDRLQGIIVALHPEDRYFEEHLAEAFPDVICVTGGAERLHSVAAGLLAIQDRAAEDDWVLVHDAVRPCLHPDDLHRLVYTLEKESVGGILAMPVGDTLKRADAQGEVSATLPREDYWLAATPQMFRFAPLIKAITLALDENRIVTDEAAALEYMNYPVRLVAGRRDNIKITSAEDLALAEFILQQQALAGSVVNS
jgi:2-C-methyl-D-erythritol 4-phosphate cytidylyltransferase